MEIFKIPFQAMASPCEIVLAAQNKIEAHAVAQKAIDEVRRIEMKFSRYRPDSVISAINAAAGQSAVACDEETWALLDYAQSLFVSSGGSFDITSGVLRKAWNFKEPRIPSDDTLHVLQQLVGWQDVERENHAIRLPRHGMELDFGGFGKEYAADRAAAILAHQGICNGYVNLAGDMRVIGPKLDGQPWMIGIQNPRNKSAMIATIPIATGGLATSGDYERFFEIDGKRYCHIIHPHTAQPVSYWRSVSVLAPFAIVAGSCSTIAMLKQDAGRDYLHSTGLRYLAVDGNGTIFTNAGTQM